MTMANTLGCTIAAVLTVTALIGCGSPEPLERESATEESILPATKVTPEERPFRISGKEIVTDTFDVRYDLRDGNLTVALDTDLGDAAKLMVTVSRSYWERGSHDEHSVNYFSESSTVGAWRDPRTINLDHDAWNREIEQHQKVFAAAGEPFTIARIADDIEISFVVPVNQDPPFERMNANLTGDVVTQSGKLRIVQREVVIAYPINAATIGQTRFADPIGLANGTTYRAAREVPLVPEIDPPDPIAAIASIQRLGPGGEFTVLETAKRRNTPWYRVRTRVGEGWINSTALIGQEIVVVR